MFACVDSCGMAAAWPHPVSGEGATALCQWFICPRLAVEGGEVEVLGERNLRGVEGVGLGRSLFWR